MTYFDKFIDFITRHNLYESKSFIEISNKTKNINFMYQPKMLTIFGMRANI